MPKSSGKYTGWLTVAEVSERFDMCPHYVRKICRGDVPGRVFECTTEVENGIARYLINPASVGAKRRPERKRVRVGVEALEKALSKQDSAVAALVREILQQSEEIKPKRKSR